MAKANLTTKDVRLSLMDRLSEHTMEAYEYESPTVQDLIHAVERDLQNLLNTRKARTELPSGYGELEQSLYDYGIPDLTSVNVNSQTEKKNFCQAVEHAIATYEPRLKQVHVEMLDKQKDNVSLILQFRVAAVLMVEPTPIPVEFDSALKSDTRLFDVEGHVD
tara:strand:+ start:426 stop:914 length:489 start_codon:yes stop_codon:yes gene_type:complete